MRRIIRALLIITAGCLVNSVGLAAEADKCPSDVQAVLDSAGENCAELLGVINHFQAAGDSLKLKAAYFLIGNMEDHCYVTNRLRDTAGATVDLDPLSFENYDALVREVDSLEAARGEIDYEMTDKIMDLKTITADYLINHIDLAFFAWRQKPWARHLTFDEFCRYVLPYRGSNEPLEDWRSYFLDKYAGLDTLMSNPNDPVEAAGLINSDVRSWFGFDPRYYYHPTDQGLAEMLASGLGRCEDMTNLAIYALRANGLAVTSDYTPYWANTGGNHAWNAILTAFGEVVPFMGAEADPGNYRLHNKAAKVNRKTFDRQKNNLAFQDNPQTVLPRWLAGKYYADVTADYMEVSDVTVECPESLPDSIAIAYICVFNDGEFRPIHWGRIADSRVTFSAMGRGVAYLPATYQNDTVVPLAPPLLLADDGAISFLTADTGRTTSVIIEGVTDRAQAASTETIKGAPLSPGQKYTLSYWSNGWQTVSEFVADSLSVTIPNLPAGGLYWLTAENGGKKERIFTVEEGRQIFW